MKGTFSVVGILDNWKKGDLPSRQMVNITLKCYSTLGSGDIAIGMQSGTDEEVDFEINRLIKDLKKIGKKAKEKIKRDNARIQSY